MSRTEYLEEGEMRRGTLLGPFLDALAPVLRRYGLDYRADELERAVAQIAPPYECVTCVIGDPAGAHLAYRSVYDPGCGYDTPGDSTSVTSGNLVDADSGERLEFRIGLTDFTYPPCYISLKFEGTEEEIAVIRQALEPVLEGCDYRRA